MKRVIRELTLIDADALRALPIPDSDDKIVMLAYSTPFRNVLRYTPDWFVVWQAELPTRADDIYTSITWKDKLLSAFSRSCISVVLDIETGRIISPQNERDAQ